MKTKQAIVVCEANVSIKQTVVVAKRCFRQSRISTGLNRVSRISKEFQNMRYGLK